MQIPVSLTMAQALATTLALGGLIQRRLARDVRLSGPSNCHLARPACLCMSRRAGDPQALTPHTVMGTGAAKRSRVEASAPSSRSQSLHLVAYLRGRAGAKQSCSSHTARQLGDKDPWLGDKAPPLGGKAPRLGDTASPLGDTAPRLGDTALRDRSY